MRQRHTVTMNEEKLLSFARSYLADGFPNPERRGCPSSQALQRLAKQPTQADLSITEHLSCCSSCFREYQELLAGLRLEKPSMSARHGILHLTSISIYVGAGVALFSAAAFCFVLWRSHRREAFPITAQTRTSPAPRIACRKTSSCIPFVLDMRDSSQVRGSKRQPRPAVKVRRTPLRVSVYLPMGSDVGMYRASLTSAHKKVWSGVATTAMTYGIAVAEFNLDVSSYPPGGYTLKLSSSDGTELSQDLIVEDRGQRK